MLIVRYDSDLLLTYRLNSVCQCFLTKLYVISVATGFNEMCSITEHVSCERILLLSIVQLKYLQITRIWMLRCKYYNG